jgi:cyclomaltodextrinase
MSPASRPPWVRHAVLWHVYPLGFLGAPTQGDPHADPVPRLRGLVGWLDHLVELGANGLLLGPVFQSESHGYDTSDHFRVDTRLGTEADLDHLLEQAHARGIRVVLDGVFNHVGRPSRPSRGPSPTAPARSTTAGSGGTAPATPTSSRAISTWSR